jgi:cytochrome c5
MSDNAHAHDEHAAHEGPVKTPKQLVLAVIFSFLVPIVGSILLVNFVASGTKSGAGSDGFSEEAVAARIRPVGTVELRDPSAPRVLKTGQEVYQAQCVACHGAGLAGAPKFGDAAAWAPRVAQGYETLLNSALKGKGAMGAQGGGEFSDLEIGRAVVYMVNNSGGNLPEPAAPAAAAAASQ